MTDQEFAAWAAQHGLNAESIERLVLCAASHDDMQAAYEAISPPPPVYTLDDIKEMSETDNYGFWPLEHGLMLIGGCPNGDPIAIDTADDMGSVWYIDHTSMHNTPPRKVAVRVADDVESLLNGLAYEDEFPIDYYNATKHRRQPGS